MLRGLCRRLFFGVFFSHMPSDETAAHRAGHRVMPRIVPRDSTHYRSFDTAGRVRGAGHCRRECHRRQGGPNITSFHCGYRTVVELTGNGLPRLHFQ